MPWNEFSFKKKDHSKLPEIQRNPEIMTGGYILGFEPHSNSVNVPKIIEKYKKPSLNNALVMSSKPLAIEFWHTLMWPTMPDELRTLSEQPLPSP